MQAGDVVDDRFFIERLAGAGGMGHVYRARDWQTGGPVALKILHGGAAQDHGRFAREAAALAGLQLPGVVRYIAHGFTEWGQPYLAMEWLEGETLSELLAREGLTVRESLAFARRVARTLGAVHRQGIVHRDLKPSNLLIVGGAIENAILIDFGLARVALDQQLTTPGAIIGTPGYMAPEQARGESAIDPRTDVFALGCVIYKCLTGRAAFQGAGGLAVLMKVILDEPPRSRDLRHSVPAALDDLVARMLSKSPNDRPPNGDAVADELDAMDGAESGSAALTSPRSRPPELTSGERKMLCLVVAREHVPAGELTLLEAKDRTVVRSLRQVADRYEGGLELIEARLPVIVLSGPATPIDLAARAARCALALQGMLKGAPVALVTGRAEMTARLPVGDLIDRAFQMLAVFDDAHDARERDAQESPGIRIDEVTAGLLGPRFHIAQDAAGRVLHGARDDADVAPQLLLGKPTACVGRERELSLLAAEVDRCVDESAAGAVLITSEAGMGKSRLRQELVRQVRARPGDAIEVWIGQGDPMGAGSAFGLLASALRDALGIVEGEPVPTRQRKVQRRVERYGSLDAPRISAFLGELVGAPFADADDLQLRAARRDSVLMGDQLRLAWEEFLRAECEARPVLLVLEDLHWGDLPTVTMVESALRNLKDLPFLVLALGRPEVHKLFPKLWHGRLSHELHLTPLPRRASERLVRQVLGDGASPELVSRLVERADGNAFFLEEQIRAAADGKSEGLPETVVAMVQARLEALDAEARRVLRAASIFGDAFRSSAVASLLGGLDVAPLLAELHRSEVIVRRGAWRPRDDVEYSFRHALVREAAYGMLTARDRCTGHALAGSWLEAAGEDDPMVLAEHFERGDEAAKAAAWYLRAADQALRGSDLAAAIACAERGVACGPEPATVSALRLIQAEAHLWRGEPALAEQLALEAKELAVPESSAWFSTFSLLAGAGQKQGDYDRVERWMVSVIDATALPGAVPAKSTCLIEGAIALLSGGRYALVDRLIDAVERAMEDASELDAITEPKLLYLHGLLRYHSGDPSACLEGLEAALAGFEQIGDRRESCRARVDLGSCYGQLGHHDAAEAALRAGLLEAERMALDDIAPSALQSLGLVLAHRGQFAAAQAAERSAIEASQRRGDQRVECGSRLTLARILLLAGEAAPAEAEARATEELARRIPPCLPLYLAVRARALLQLGRADEALALSSEALSSLASSRDEGTEPLLRLVHAEALSEIGDLEGAASAIAAARNDLLIRAARISDPTWRDRFLSDIRDNARILELARSWLGEAPPRS